MKRTPLFDFHIQYGAKMVDFAGWEMPLLYAGIVEEHHHTRQAASVFDVSHMGRIEFHGADVEKLLQRVCTRQLGDAQPGQSRYSHVCNESGGILDDVIVSRYPDHWMMVCNASNRERILNWLHRHAEGLDVRIEDITEATLMIALQGPQVIPLLSQKLPLPVADLKRYRFLTGSYMGITYSVFRSGYTGEDGVEIILPANMAAMIAGYFPGLEPENVKPAGLGARDTLRLEAGMPLYGHELSDGIMGHEAGLNFCIKYNKDFIGKEALLNNPPVYKRIGLTLSDRGIAREGAIVYNSDIETGYVTSGTMSPLTGKAIAMARVKIDALTDDLIVDVRGRKLRAELASLPFYRK